MSHIDFLKESIRNLRSTGSVTRSSRFLGRAMAKKLDPARCKAIVELGPGDGAITEHILQRMPADGKLLIFEINDTFVGKLRHRFANEPRVTLIHDSAENIAKYLAAHQIGLVNYVISGIPFTMLPDDLTQRIVSTAASVLSPGGIFMQFHYSPILLPMYKRMFDRVDVDFVALNIPPAIIVQCHKKPT
jgi:phospholipid N-methyltransferase